VGLDDGEGDVVYEMFSEVMVSEEHATDRC